VKSGRRQIAPVALGNEEIPFLTGFPARWDTLATLTTLFDRHKYLSNFGRRRNVTMVVSATGTAVPERTAKKRIKKIIEDNRDIESEVDAAMAGLDSKDLLVLQEIDDDPNLTQEEKEAEKESKKRELAILSVYVNNRVFRQKVRAAL
jgi:hypothetical protein